MIFQIVLQPTTPVAPTSNNDVSAGSVASIAGVVVVFLVAAVVIAGFLRKLRKPELEGLSTQKIKQLWEQIEQSAKQGKLGGKIAVIEADKLLDNVLKSMLFPGETMGERLKMAGYKYPGIREVWTAHRVRNRLVHETDYELRDRDVRETLDDFKKALRELNVL
jgi:hypothetical protein